MNEARPTVDAVDDSLPAAPLEPADPRAERDWRASVAAGLNDTARYVMLEELARGGMGVVFRAFDDVLKREVALKLLTPRARSHARDRMLREAQALARVSHPNVVQVHDVGELADGVFLAMELVEGETLLERTRASSASWRERLRLFIQAGNGLAAAHRAGLVHRDFKPANVIVGRDGRVRVVDFGLARGLGATRARDDDETADEPREATERGAPDDSLDMPIELAGPRSTGGPLTLPGSLLGTPAYMAPEQLRREDADARSDQFAFCVALFEAVYGRRPFVGETPEDLLVAIRPGPPALRGAPRWLYSTLRTGLAYDPARRWPSMDALLRVLTRGLERRGRWLFALGATVVLGLVAGGVFAVTAPAGPGCESLTQDVAAAWSDERSARVRNQFLETGLPFAAASWTSVGAQLDRYAETLARARVDACAARRHGALSDQLLDLRAACLGDRLADLETHVSLLESADATTVERSVVATGELPAIEPCDDGSALLERARLVRPPARARAEEVAGVTETVRELRLTLELGRTGELETRASAALERARALEYPPLIASAELTLALVHNHAARYEEAESRLRAALLAAEESRVDDVAAESCALLISVVGDKLARPTEALRWSPLCGAPIRRGELGPAYTTKLESNLGALRRSLEDYPRAREHYQRALTAAEQAHGARHRAYAHALNNLGAAEEDLGELERAVEDYERSLEIERALLGDEHPDLATPLNNLAVAERKLGRLDEAAAHLRRSVALLEAARLGGHDHYGTAVGNLGTLLRDQGDFEGARETYTRALEILAGALGPNHPAVGMMAMNRGELSLLTGAPARALEDFDRALEIVSTTLGPDTQLAAIVRVNVGLSQLELGADAAALASFTRVLELPTSTLPERDALRVYASAGLGRVALARGRKAEARALLERALADAQTHVEFDRAELGELRFALARALPESERAAAATLVAAAREELASRPERRAALERWLTGANAG